MKKNIFMRILAIALIAMSIMAIAIPAMAAVEIPSNKGTGRTGCIITEKSTVNLREKPNGKAFDTLGRGNTVTYYYSTATKKNSTWWVYVENTNANGTTKQGWVSATYLKDKSGIETAPQKCVVCGSTLNGYNKSDIILKKSKKTHGDHFCNWLKIQTKWCYHCSNGHPDGVARENWETWQCLYNN